MATVMTCDELFMSLGRGDGTSTIPILVPVTGGRGVGSCGRTSTATESADLVVIDGTEPRASLLLEPAPGLPLEAVGTGTGGKVWGAAAHGKGTLAAGAPW